MCNRIQELNFVLRTRHLSRMNGVLNLAGWKVPAPNLCIQKTTNTILRLQLLILWGPLVLTMQTSAVQTHTSEKPWTIKTTAESISSYDSEPIHSTLGVHCSAKWASYHSTRFWHYMWEDSIGFHRRHPALRTGYYDKRCSHCSYRSENVKGSGRLWARNLEQRPNIYEKCILIIWVTKYVLLINHITTEAH